MTSEDSLDSEITTPQLPPGNSGDCPACGGATVFGMNEDLGYYKRCPRCGHIINLKRRFLRLDRRSRRWQ